jgi:putative transport protein
VTGLVAYWKEIPAPLAVGMFAGALTSTPGLAAAVDTLSDPSVSVGYGIAYPFGVICMVLFAQVLPRLLNDKSSPREEDGKKSSISSKQYRIENPRCEGKTLSELHLHRMTEATISRVWHEGSVLPARPDVVLQKGDVVLVVGTARELAKCEFIFGSETSVEMRASGNVVARDVFVSESQVAGKTLAELQVTESFGVVISRLSREDIEFIPKGRLRLEIGDWIRIVGNPEDCSAFAAFVGQNAKRIHETSILPFSIGIVLGVILAYFPISLPGGISIRLGLAGGPLFVGIVMGHFGGIGRLRLRTSYAVRYLLRELGLVFFLAGAGTTAGAQFLAVFREQGSSIILAGVMVTTVPMLTAFLLTHYYHKFDLPNSLGAVCGIMTSTPGLGAVSASMESDEPALAYATVYPIALIVVTIVAQILSVML